MARAVGVDLGERRIGLSRSDPSGILASPVGCVERSGDAEADRAAVLAAARAEEATVIVVGLPRSLSGSDGPAARAARSEAEALAAAAGEIRVVLHDERLTTRQASAAMSAAGRSTREQRSRIDAAAATVLLQSWLDGGGRA